MDHLTGKIKTILKPVSNPKLSYRYKIPQQLSKAHNYLISYKENFRASFEIVKINLVFDSINYLPDWLNPLSKIIEDYLDVKVIKTKVLRNNKPINTHCVIGEKSDALLATKYLEYLYTAILLLERAKRAKISNNNRKTRRRFNRNNQKVTLMDARVVSSDFRRGLLKDILNSLNILLETLKNTSPEIYMRSLARQEKLENYLHTKFGKGWRHVLSNNGY